MNAKLTAYALNELPPDERAELEAQMKSDPALRQQAEEMKAFCAMLADEVADDEATLTTAQRVSVMRAFTGEPSEKKIVRPFWQRPAFFVPTALAACVAFAMVKLGEERSAPAQPSERVTVLAEKRAAKTALPAVATPMPGKPAERPADLAKAKQAPLPALPLPILPGTAGDAGLVAGTRFMTAPEGTLSLGESSIVTPSLLTARAERLYASVDEMRFDLPPSPEWRKAANSFGDFDNGIADAREGSYVNKPDEGSSFAAASVTGNFSGLINPANGSEALLAERETLTRGVTADPYIVNGELEAMPLAKDRFNLGLRYGDTRERPLARKLELGNDVKIPGTETVGAVAMDAIGTGAVPLSDKDAATKLGDGTIALGTANGYGIHIAGGKLDMNGAVAATSFDDRPFLELSMSGNINGAAGPTKSGAGTLTLSGANTFSGTVTVNQGSTVTVGGVVLGSPANAPASSVVAGGAGDSKAGNGNLVINGGTLRSSGATTVTAGKSVAINNPVPAPGDKALDALSFPNTAGATAPPAATLTRGSNMGSSATPANEASGAIAGTGDVNLMSASTVTTRSGQRATVEFIGDVSLGSNSIAAPTAPAAPALATNTNTNTSTSTITLRGGITTPVPLPGTPSPEAKPAAPSAPTSRYMKEVAAVEDLAAVVVADPMQRESKVLADVQLQLEKEERLEQLIRLPNGQIVRSKRRDAAGETYTRIYENPFLFVAQQPLSTFSIDVDTASYANVRRFLNEGQRPPADAVRLEELINYFPYNYEGPSDGKPFGVMVDIAEAPWQPMHRLVRVALKGREIKEERGAANFVFLVDVSGSMDEPDKLPLVQRSLEMLTRQLGENDRVALVVYAGNSGLVLPSTTGNNKETILDAIGHLKAGGSTNGAGGIRLAYEQAAKHFIKGGVNRVILCTDGDFNVGISTPEELEKLIAEKAKSRVFLSVLGFGTGNLKDRTMETLADKGNGNYAYIDSLSEARKVLVEQMNGTLVTIAKDVKIQVEFNPAQVAAYRLLGYENRVLAKEDFNNDKKDAGEIGAGHTVTALYEIVPSSVKFPDGKPIVDDLKYAVTTPKPAAPPAPSLEPQAAPSNELMTVKLRYKQPEGDKSDLLEVPVTDKEKKLADSPRDFQFAASVAGFGMLLRGSQHAGELTWDMVRDLALRGKGEDTLGYRGEFLQLIDKARGLTEQRE